MSLLIVGVDPGLRQCGLASVFPSGELRFARLVKNPEREDDGPAAWLAMARAVLAALEENVLGFSAVDILAVERQQIRMKGGPRGPQLLTKNPSQIITLAQVAGCIIATVPSEQTLAVWPSTWNHNKKKAEVEEEILDGLTDEERLRFEPCNRSEQNNVADAIGLARYAAQKTSGVGDLPVDWSDA